MASLGSSACQDNDWRKQRQQREFCAAQEAGKGRKHVAGHGLGQDNTIWMPPFFQVERSTSNRLGSPPSPWVFPIFRRPTTVGRAERLRTC